MFKVTAQHKAFFDWVANPTSASAVLEAVAGSGKTSTLQQAMQRISSDESILYLAFNKAAVAEMTSRGVPTNCTPLTLNSLGFRACLRAFGRVDVDAGKTTRLIRARYGERSMISLTLTSTIKALVGKAKTVGLVPTEVAGAHGVVADTRNEWMAIVDQFGIDAPNDDDALLDTAIECAREILRDGIRDVVTIDFDDQIYLPVVMRLPMPKFQWVLIDEAQDISILNRRMLARCIDDDGHLIACGDRHQSIYGFRGAAFDSIDAIVEEFNAQLFPLSVTYRCPKRVVIAAQAYVPHIEACESAADGEIHVGVAASEINWLPTDLVVCRNNAPLVTLAYALLRKRVPCRISGRDIGTGLAALIKKLKARDLEDLLNKLAKHVDKQVAKLLKANREAAIASLQDQAETLTQFAIECKTLAELTAAINELFTDDLSRPMTTLSSVHKAKGGEADRVIILDPWRFPSKRSTSTAALQQERNLYYVALTRARRELVFATINGGAMALPPAKF